MKFRYIAYVVMAVVLSGLFMPAAAKRAAKRSMVDDDHRKADYIYLEAKRQSLQGRMDAYFDLMDYAAQLNPDDRLYGMELGVYYASLDTTDSERGVRLMQDYVLHNPDDLYNAYMYAQFCTRAADRPRALEAWRLLYERFPDRLPLTQRYADALRTTGDSLNLVRAYALYDTLEMRGAEPIEMAASRATVRLMQSDTLGVAAEVQRLLASDPKNVDYNIFAGQIYQNVVNPDSALVFFNRAVELDPENGMAYYSRASYYNARNDSVAFDREVFNALRQNDLDNAVKLALMRDYVIKLYSDSTQQPRINELFAILSEQNPHNADVHNLYSDYLLAVKDFAGATEQLDYSLDLEPDNQRGWFTLASLYMEENDNERALETARRGQRYFPGDQQLKRVEIFMLITQDKLGEAMDVLEKAIADTDSMDVEMLSDLYSNIGDIYYKQDSLDAAFKAYEQALEYNPANYMAMNNAAYYMACSGNDLPKALTMIEQAIAGRPDDPTTLDTYAWVLFKMKDYGKAMEIIDRVVDLDTEPSAEVFEHAGDIHFMNADPDGAVEFWKKARELDPDNELLQRKVANKTYFYK